MKALTQEEIAYFKEKLRKERAEVETRLKKVKVPTDFGNDIDGSDEETDESEEFGNQLGVQRLLEEQRNDIDAALERIAAGTYGICASCKKPIEREVLEVDPESALCRSCKAKSTP